MSVYKRQEIPEVLKKIKQGDTTQIYLIHGERYLCRSASQELIDHLLPEQESRAAALHHIDGDQEDFNRTLTLLKTSDVSACIRCGKLIIEEGCTVNGKICALPHRT